MRLVAIVAAVLLYALPASAQHSHGAKGPNGGVVEDVAGVHAELVAKGNVVTINVLDENNKPIATKGYSGSLLIVSGSDRETVTLAPSGDSALKGEAKKAVASNANVTLMLKTDKGKMGQARYAMK